MQAKGLEWEAQDRSCSSFGERETALDRLLYINYVFLRAASTQQPWKDYL